MKMQFLVTKNGGMAITTVSGGLDLREDPIKGPCIADVTEMPASDVETVMACCELVMSDGRRADVGQ